VLLVSASYANRRYTNDKTVVSREKFDLVFKHGNQHLGFKFRFIKTITEPSFRFTHIPDHINTIKSTFNTPITENIWKQLFLWSSNIKTNHFWHHTQDWLNTNILLLLNQVDFINTAFICTRQRNLTWTYNTLQNIRKHNFASPHPSPPLL